MIVGTFPASKAVEILTDDQSILPNPTQVGASPDGIYSTPPLAKLVLADDKSQFKAFVVKPVKGNFTPIKSVCDTPAVGPKNPTRIVTIQPFLYGGKGNYCADDMLGVCYAYEGNTAMQRALSPLAASEPAKAVWSQKITDFRNEWANIVLFSKIGYGVNTASNAAPFYLASGTDSATPAFIAQQGQQDGFWALLQKYAADSSVAYVDVNDGTNKGIINPDTVATYLRAIKMKAKPVLRNAPRNGEGMCFYLVDRAVFDALKRWKELQAAGSESAWLSVQSQARNGVMEFEGFWVYLDAAADIYDSESGAMLDSSITVDLEGGATYNVTHSRNCRVVFTAARRTLVATDMTSTEGSYGNTPAIYVWEGSPETGDQGRVNWLSYLVVGVELENKDMFVVGFPSDNDTFN